MRVIGRLDIKNEHVIKGIHLEGLRKVGDPVMLAEKYYNNGVDELILMDAVASYYDRNLLKDVILKTTEKVFIPITVGGGIRTVNDIKLALSCGADKVAINTAAVQKPMFITEVSKIFGSQCIVSQIDTKKNNQGFWEVYTDSGREPTGLELIDWCKKVENLGAGEILLTSIDTEGTKKGFDLELIRLVDQNVSIPVIVSGGAGNVDHVVDLSKNSFVSGVALASVLHYGLTDIHNIKISLEKANIEVRV